MRSGLVGCASAACARGCSAWSYAQLVPGPPYINLNFCLPPTYPPQQYTEPLMTASEILKKQSRFSMIPPTPPPILHPRLRNNEEVKIFLTLAQVPSVHCWRIFAYIERQSNLQLLMQIQKDACPWRGGQPYIQSSTDCHSSRPHSNPRLSRSFVLMSTFLIRRMRKSWIRQFWEWCEDTGSDSRQVFMIMTTDDYTVCICKEFVKVTLALCWSLRCVPFYSWDVASISELKVAFTHDQNVSGLALSIRTLLHWCNFHFTNPSLGFCQHIHPPTFHADGVVVACTPSSPSVYVESSAKRTDSAPPRILECTAAGSEIV